MTRESKKKIVVQNEVNYPPLDDEQSRLKRELLSEPIRQITISQDMRVADLVRSMAGMSVQARNLGQCAMVLDKLYDDPKRQTVMLGLAGPLIAAGLRNVIRDLIVYGFVDVVVSTGAILYQDIYQARGLALKALRFSEQSGVKTVGIVENLFTGTKKNSGGFPCLSALPYDAGFESALGNIDRLRQTDVYLGLRKVVIDRWQSGS